MWPIRNERVYQRLSNNQSLTSTSFSLQKFNLLNRNHDHNLAFQLVLIVRFSHFQIFSLLSSFLTFLCLSLSIKRHNMLTWLNREGSNKKRLKWGKNPDPWKATIFYIHVINWVSFSFLSTFKGAERKI